MSNKRQKSDNGEVPSFKRQRLNEKQKSDNGEIPSLDELIKASETDKVEMKMREDLEILNEIVRKWKTVNKDWMLYENVPHDCDTTDLYKSKTNTITNNKRKDELSSTIIATGCSIVRVVCTVWKKKSTEGEELHLCYPDWCNYFTESDEISKAMHYCKVETISNVYICSKTGKHHFCFPFCKKDDQIINSDGTYVCKYSNNSQGEMQMIDKFWSKQIKNVNKTNVMNQLNSRTRNSNGEEFDDIETIVRKCNLANLEDIMKKKKNLTSPKNAYLAEAIIRLSRLFCKERFVRDKEIDENAKTDMIALFKKYVNKRNTTGEALYSRDLFTITLAHRRRKSHNVDMTNLTDAQIINIILLYARKCLELWVVIRTKTPKGIKKPALFPWSEFIESALSVFENGYDISQYDYRYRYTLIEQDSWLPLLPHNSPYIKEKANNKKSKKNNTTKIMNNIYTALTNAIVKHHVQPEELTLSSVDLDRISPETFIKLRNKHKEIKKEKMEYSE